jgi:hypothetical protein
MQPTIPNTRDFEIMLKIVPIDGIGLKPATHTHREECEVKSVHACPKLNRYSL